MGESKKFYSIPEAARLSGVSRTTLWSWVKSGHIKALVTPGGHHRILKEEVELILKDNASSVRQEENHQKIVLIVDDDPQVQKILKSKLSGMNIYIETAADGFDAGIKVAEFIPDLVVLDLFMPGIDGFEVCKRIKGENKLRNTRIIAMSGMDSSENRDRILGLGADCFFSKAGDIRALIMEIEKLLQDT